MDIKISDILKGKTSVAIGGHIHPDGDCVGSCMGMYLYLKKAFPQIKTDVYLQEIPGALRLIHSTEEIKNQIPADAQYDLFICLDCGSLDRLVFSEPLFHNAKARLCVDHHVSNQGFADINYIVTSASSTSELVYGLLDPAKIDLPVAEALYMGIVHDTGVFRFSCTSPQTMEVAARLLQIGVNGNEIIDKTFYEKTFAQNKILGKALLDSRLILNKHCIVTVLTINDLKSFGVDYNDLEGIVSQLWMTRDIDVAMFIYELEPDYFKVSLRSGDQVDVSLVATCFGGGGHMKAAGFNIGGPVQEAIETIGRELLKQIKTMPDQEDVL